MKPSVLVVEDEPLSQKYLKMILDERFDVLLAASGDEARAHLDSHPGRIALVLMDLSLKGTEDGLALTRRLRADRQWREVPIVATTAHAFPEDRHRALAAGCTRYLAKPFRSSELFAIVDELLA